MNYGNQYSNSVVEALESLYVRFINFLPDFLVAVIILILGWVIAMFVAKIIKQVLHTAKVDELGDKLGLDEVSSRTGMKLTVSGAISWLIKWFLLLAVFLAAADILNLPKVSEFFYKVLFYVPNVITAAAILLVGTLAARFLSRLVRHSVSAAGLSSADMIGAVTKWAVMIFTILATLSQLNVARDFVGTLFTGFVYMLALAGGLAFGLGGKEHASRALDKIEKDLKS